MTRFLANALLLLILYPVAMFAQDTAIQDPQVLNGGVPVRPTTKISLPEKVGLVLKGALVPGRKLVEPLHAYEPSIVCYPSKELRVHLGTAAIVVISPDPNTDIAYYYPTVSDAIEDAKRNWCGEGGDWFFATTYPLRDIGPKNAEARYLSRELDRIDDVLLAFRTEKDARGSVQ